MGQGRWLTGLLRALVAAVYAGPVRRAVEATGLEPVLGRLYGVLLQRLGGDTVRIEAAGVNATIAVTGPEEARMVHATASRESPVLDRVIGSIREDDVFYDVGANVGVYSCLAGAAAADVVAFEPAPWNREALERNLGLNGLDAAVAAVALSDASGEARLDAPTGAPGDNQRIVDTSSASADEAGDGGATVRTVRAETLVGERYPPPDVLKIDVEGAEMRVLEGFEAVLDERPPRRIYCEVHPEAMRRFGDEPGDVEEFLAARGYAVDRLAEPGDRYHLVATR